MILFSHLLACPKIQRMTYLLLIIATLLTSVISGVLSMAGGTILMGVFSFFLSIPAAMVLHGIAQACSNGSRLWIYRRHVHWRVVNWYTLGALLVLGLFSLLTFVPDPAVVFLLIGSFPFLAQLLPKSVNLDVQRPAVSFMAGLLVTTAQMLAGASGPVLDLFYIRSSMTREAVLGTKAVTQTLGHLLKLGYYAVILSFTAVTLPAWLIPIVVLAAIGGNVLASHVVARISDAQFRQAGSIVMMLIGLLFIVKGVLELLRS